MKSEIKIKKADHINDYVIKIVFSDGKEQSIDFEQFIKASHHPEVRKFLNRKKFTNFVIRDGDLMWGDFDLIFPIMDLYQNKIIKNKTDDSKYK